MAVSVKKPVVLYMRPGVGPDGVFAAPFGQNLRVLAARLAQNQLRLARMAHLKAGPQASPAVSLARPSGAPGQSRLMVMAGVVLAGALAGVGLLASGAA